MTNPNEPINFFSEAMTGVGINHTVGLTKREYFAAMALQGLMIDLLVTADTSPDDIPDHVLAKEAVKAADALIIELNKASK